MNQSRHYRERLPRTIPGVLISVFNTGTLIWGPAGVGKSALALGLIDRGHKLIADDAVEIEMTPEKKLLGRAPTVLRGFLEVRSLGVLDVAALFGEQALADTQTVDLGIRLQREASVAPRCEEGDRRIGNRWGRRILSGVRIPQLVFSAGTGQDLPLLVETAVRELILRGNGYNGAARLRARQRRLTQQGSS